MKNLHRLFLCLVFLFSALFLFNLPVSAQLPPNFQKTLLLGSGLDSPTSFEIAPDGRIFITELQGKIKVFKNGELLPSQFAELPALAMNDRGLLNMTIDPDFVSNHHLYFYYIDKNDSFHKVVRFNASADIGADQTLVYTTKRGAAELHAGGGLDFGSDGKLYLAIGDSGPSTNAQDLSIPMGKVLRMNKDGTVPVDNPYFGLTDHDAYIWAHGFRNPFRMQFDSLTGVLYLGDVGYQKWEEINIIEKGNNYGWPLTEGDCGSCLYKNPIYQYATSGGASVIIGPNYQGANFPEEYKGKLFFGDYVKKFIKTFNPDSTSTTDSIGEFEQSSESVIDIKSGPDGALYYLTIYPGTFYKVIYSEANKAPTSIVSANITEGVAPLIINFLALSSDPEGDTLTYNWNFGDGTYSTEKNPVKTYEKIGKFSVILTTGDASHTIESLPIEIQAGIPPQIIIESPVDKSTYKAGDIVNFSFSAKDSNGNILNDAYVSREVIFHHNIHTHPFLPGENISQGTFVIPKIGESDPDQWYEILFQATDAKGITSSSAVNIYPEKNNVTFNTVPEGLTILVDGAPLKTPVTKTGVVGYTHTVKAEQQYFNDFQYEFDRWSDNGLQTHAIDISQTPTIYTAYFKTSSLPSINEYSAEYFDNQKLEGSPKLVRTDPEINFSWNSGSPDQSIPSDQFSARWIKKVNFETGIYQFLVTADDGVRLYIDDQLVIDKWINQSSTTYLHDQYLSAGEHVVKMEYYEAFGGAVARLNYVKLSSDFDAEYFDNQNILGIAKVKRLERNINLVLAEGSPAVNIPSDHFSARWNKKQYFAQAKDYSFTLRSDDGVRFWIDGKLIVDDWNDHSMKTHKPVVNLSAGIHHLNIEYYENQGNSVMTFNQNTQ